MKTIEFKDLEGLTAFLNGQEGLHDTEEELLEAMKAIGCQTLVLDNLFEEPAKLQEVRKCDNIILSTTGLYGEQLRPLIAAFESMNYVPKRVVFCTENTAMMFLGIARKLKSEHGTQFFFLGFLNKDLNEISWI